MLRAIEEDTMNNNALYSQSETYAAALHAYAMSACADLDWQQQKAEQFVARVVRAQNFEHGTEENIILDIYAEDPVLMEEYLHNVCYAALDARCENAFWLYLQNNR